MGKNDGAKSEGWLSTKKQIKALERRLTKGAEKIVGKVGRPTMELRAATGEPVVKYFTRFQDADLDDVVSRALIEQNFLGWINSYRVFVEGVVREGGLVKNGWAKRGGSVLYWRRKPEVVEHEGYIYVNARLLISDLVERKRRNETY